MESGQALSPPLCYAEDMARIIRRTLTITIREQWTFVWSPEQTNDATASASGGEEAAVMLSPAQIVQQLCHLLGLSAPTVDPAGCPVQLSIQYPAKEFPDEDVHP